MAARLAVEDSTHLKNMGVSKIRGFYSPNHPFVHRVFPYKPSILGYHYFWKHPYAQSSNWIISTRVGVKRWNHHSAKQLGHEFCNRKMKISWNRLSRTAFRWGLGSFLIQHGISLGGLVNFWYRMAFRWGGGWCIFDTDRHFGGVGCNWWKSPFWNRTWAVSFKHFTRL